MARSHVFYPGWPPSRKPRRAWTANSGARLLAWAGAVIVLVSPLVSALRQRGSTNLRARDSPPTQEVEAQDVVCSANTRAAAKMYVARLSESNPKVTLQCEGTDTAVPASLTDGLVCPESCATLAECGTARPTNGKTLAQPVSLSSLMGGEKLPQVKWVKTSPGGQANKYELSLPAAPLPLLDAKFLTGCAAGPSEANTLENECKLKVTVEARKSAASGQTVYCAYGKHSNAARPTVTVTTKNNTVTLVCGNKEATVQPTSYKTDYCADGDASDACAKETYTSLIKEFQTSWWTSNDDDKSVTLTIPPAHFPDTPKTIHLGCQYKAGGADTPRSEEAETSCSVNVVISARESSALGRTVAALPGIGLGAVALCVSLVMQL